MLARVHGPVSVSVSVDLSVTSRYSSKRDELINLLFDIDASFDQPNIAILGNSGIYINKLRYFPLELFS